MGKLRKASRRQHRTVQDVFENLPERFLRADVVVVEGQQVGLRDYMKDLQAHLSLELHREVSMVEVVEVMCRLGADPARWTFHALQQQDAADRIAGVFTGKAVEPRRGRSKPELRVVT
jgi:hypothetical protein